MQNYSNLRVTERAREVVREAYLATASFPKAEIFGLTSQMRRASISAALNIAEGCSRRSTAELIRFLEFSVGSTMELDMACVLAGDLGFGEPSAIALLKDHNRILLRELSALIGSLRKRKALRQRQ